MLHCSESSRGSPWPLESNSNSSTWPQACPSSGPSSHGAPHSVSAMLACPPSLGQTKPAPAPGPLHLLFMMSGSLPASDHLTASSSLLLGAQLKCRFLHCLKCPCLFRCLCFVSVSLKECQFPLKECQFPESGM